MEKEILTLSIHKNMYAVEDSLVELARKAGSFMVTLVEQGSIATFSDSDAMKSVIEGLTKCVLLTTFMYYYSHADKRTSQRNEAGSGSRQEDFFSKIGDASSS